MVDPEIIRHAAMASSSIEWLLAHPIESGIAGFLIGIPIYAVITSAITCGRAISCGRLEWEPGTRETLGISGVEILVGTLLYMYLEHGLKPYEIGDKLSTILLPLLTDWSIISNELRKELFNFILNKYSE